MTTFHPLLAGAIELHCHTAPSIFPRRQNDWELVADLLAAGMAGAVVKAHEAPTADRAALVRVKHPQLHFYGGLACNHFTGGLAPAAVDAAIRAGAKVIWMPTFSSRTHQEHFAKQKSRLFTSEKPLTHPATGIDIRDERGNLRPEVREILALVAEANILLATGHLSPEEVVILVAAAREQGVEKILIQHTDLGIARIPFDLEVQLAAQGAVLEKCYLACSQDFNDLTVPEMAESIRRLGAENCVLVTDYGQRHNIPPVAALSEFVTALLEAGLDEREVETMIVAKPKQLLGI